MSASLPSPAAPGHVVVVGAGIVGACCALALLDGGWRVSIVDPAEPGGAQAASFGNGGWISPASVVPMSTPGVWRRVPGWLLDHDGPLALRPGALPALAPWLWRFVRAGADLATVRRTSAALGAMLRDAPARHSALASAAGVAHLVAQRGLLYAYPDRAAYEADRLAWSLRREQGVGWTEFTRPGGADDGVPGRDPLARLAPWLSSSYRHVAWVEAAAHCTDPGAYVAALVRHARRRGAEWIPGRAVDWVWRDGVAAAGASRLRGVAVEAAGRVDLLPADRAVLCAGIHSGPLSARAGSRMPMVSERGYHLVLPWRSGAGAVPSAWAESVPVMPSDGKMALTPTHGGLRVAGQVELARLESPPDPRRLDVLWRHARRGVAAPRQADLLVTPPGVAWPEIRPDALPQWLGHRPSTPDGLPVIGRAARSPDVVLAFGHGHVGLATALAAAAAVARRMHSPPGDDEPVRACDPRRFL